MADPRRDLAKCAIDEGRIPAQIPDDMWGGRGTGRPCAVCREPISPEEAELQVHVRPTARGKATVLSVHGTCGAAWRIEAAALDRAS